MSPPRVFGPRRAGPWLLCLGASALALALAAWLAPHVELTPLPAYVLAFALVSASALATGACVPLWTWTEALAATTLGLLALIAMPVAPATWIGAVGVTGALLVACSSLGGALGARIDRPGHLVAVALVSSIADLWSVFDPAAPSARLAASIEAAGPAVLSRWVLPFPMLGTADLVPVMGAGDVAFIALYAAAARSHALSLSRMLAALGLGCALALGCVLWWMRPLPMLPLLGACVVLLVPEARQLQRREWGVLTLVTVGALLALLVRSA